MHRDLRLLETEVTAAIAGLNATQMQATPRGQPGKWNIQQIVEHLIQTYRNTTPAIQARLDKGRPTRASATIYQRMAQFFVLTLGRFPNGRKAPASVSPPVPTALRSGDELLSKVSAELMLLDAVTAYGERIFGNRRAASHLVLGPLSMSGWRRFHLSHGMHHMLQIQAIRSDHAIETVEVEEVLQPSSSISSSTLRYRRM